MTAFLKPTEFQFMQALGDENMASPTIEGGCERLATKADLERLRADVARWLFQLGVAIIGALGLAVAFLKFTG